VKETPTATLIKGTYQHDVNQYDQFASKRGEFKNIKGERAFYDKVRKKIVKKSFLASHGTVYPAWRRPA